MFLYPSRPLCLASTFKDYNCSINTLRYLVFLIQRSIKRRISIIYCLRWNVRLSAPVRVWCCISSQGVRSLLFSIGTVTILSCSDIIETLSFTFGVGIESSDFDGKISKSKQNTDFSFSSSFLNRHLLITTIESLQNSKRLSPNYHLII